MIGDDEHWDISLIKLFWRFINESFQQNVTDLNKHHMFDMDKGVLHGVRVRIEDAFSKASCRQMSIEDLNALLNKHGLFEEYQDRFFSLVRQSR